LTDEAFRVLRDLIERNSGINLSEAKRPLVVGRLGARLKALGIATFEEYARFVVADDEEFTVMLDRITTNETHFFREPRHFEYLTAHLIPSWRSMARAGTRERRVRVWSAACSTGEEPFSLAMSLRDLLPPADDWTIEVEASDISTRVLEKAQAAVWPIERASEIPPETLRRHMLRGVDAHQGTMKATEELRALIRFRRINLVGDTLPIEGPFDAIFCRNVLMYFGREARLRAIERLVDRLAKDGVLFVGHAESITGITPRLRMLAPTIYGRAEMVTSRTLTGARR
jgi:chemotaxis protein methyltransferase CheR